MSNVRPWSRWRSYWVRMSCYIFMFCALVGIVLVLDGKLSRGSIFLGIAAGCLIFSPIRRIFVAAFLGLVAFRSVVAMTFHREYTYFFLPVALVSVALTFAVLRFWLPAVAETQVHFPDTAEEAFPDILTMGGLIVLWVWLDYLRWIRNLGS